MRGIKRERVGIKISLNLRFLTTLKTSLMDLKKHKETEIYKELECLLNQIKGYAEGDQAAHHVELNVYQQLLKLGKKLLMYYFYLVGERLKFLASPIDSSGKKMSNKGRVSRKYLSIFGELEISRIKYFSKEDKVYYRMDQQIGLPKDKYSYLLIDWLSFSSTEMDFDQSVQLFNRILNQDLSAMQSSRATYFLSKEVEGFYETKTWESKGDYLSLGLDGKGVPVIRSEIGRDKHSTSTRVERGGRRGVKKEATVCVSSSFTARKRDAEEIIKALFRTEKLKKQVPHKFHENKHMRAFIANKIKGINYAVDNLIKRDPSGKKPIVVLIDGEPALRNQVKKIMTEKGIIDRMDSCILDFIHVLEKVWKVANAHLGEQSKERASWVEQQARLLLTGKLKTVLREWKRIQGAKKYSVTQAKNIKDAIRYCEKREEMMDYKTFLSKGYPITTGAVESACGHFVKSRMERAAMHWGLEGGQKMLNIRAVKKNGDWDQYVKDFIQKEQQQLYSKRAA